MARLAGFAPKVRIPNQKTPTGGDKLTWLGWQDSNLRMTGPKPVALPLGEGPICKIF